MPVMLMSENSAKVNGVVFDFTNKRPQNGTRNTMDPTRIENGRHGPPVIRNRKLVSSGKLPYQITRNWENIRYVQNTVKPKMSLPKSWSCWRPMSAWASSRFRQ